MNLSAALALRSVSDDGRVDVHVIPLPYADADEGRHTAAPMLVGVATPPVRAHPASHSYDRSPTLPKC